MMNVLGRAATSFAAALALVGPAAAPALSAASGHGAAIADRLYTIDCGLTEFEDAAYFADTGEYDGKSLKLPTPCYLIRHGGDWLLWDTGNGDRLATLPGGKLKFGGRFTMKRTLTSQLAQLGLKPDDIRYVALSHLHQDHTGNIPLFPKATFIVSKMELAWARSQPTPFGVDAEAIAPLARDIASRSGSRLNASSAGDLAIRLMTGHSSAHGNQAEDRPDWRDPIARWRPSPLLTASTAGIGGVERKSQ